MKLEQALLNLDYGCTARRLVRNLWLVLLAVLISVGSMRLLLAFRYQPTYSSTATYVVMSRAASSTMTSNQSAANEAATMMSEIIVSEVMKNRLREAIGDDAVQAELEATVAGGTNLLVVTAIASSSRTAYSVLNAAAEYFDEYFGSIDSSSVLHCISAPQIPQYADSGINTVRYLVLAGAGGAVAMLLLLLLLYLRLDTIQSRSGAAEKLDMDVLVTLPHERTKPMLNSRRTGFYYTENIYRLRSRLETAAAERAADAGAMVILVTSTVANEGKSTVAANLALALAEKQRNVLLMDMDFRNPSQKELLDLEGSGELGLAALLRADRIQAQSVRNAILYDRSRNLMLMSEDTPTSDALNLFAGQQLQVLMTALRNAMRYIVIDAPPAGFFPDGQMLSDLADATLLVVRQDVVSACDINDVADSLRQGNAELLGCVLNDMRGSTGTGYGYGYGSGYGYGYGYGYGSGKHYGYGRGSRVKEEENG